MTNEDRLRKALQTIADLPIVYPYELTEFVKRELENANIRED